MEFATSVTLRFSSWSSPSMPFASMTLRVKSASCSEFRQRVKNVRTVKGMAHSSLDATLDGRRTACPMARSRARTASYRSHDRSPRFPPPTAPAPPPPPPPPPPPARARAPAPPTAFDSRYDGVSQQSRKRPFSPLANTAIRIVAKWLRRPTTSQQVQCIHPHVLVVVVIALLPPAAAAAEQSVHEEYGPGWHSSILRPDTTAYCVLANRTAG